MSTRRTASFGLGVALFGWSMTAQAVEEFDAFTLSSVVNQSVNVLAAHQRLLRAQTLTDYQGFYFGFAGRGAPAKYLMADGTTLDAGLARWLLAFGGRYADLAPGFSVYGGVQLDVASVSDWPNIMGPAGSSKGKGETIVGFYSEALIHGGVTYEGLSLAGGAMATSIRFDADPSGRFVPEGYPDESGRNFRPGTPGLVRARQGEQDNSWTYFVDLDSDRGYSLGALISEVEQLSERGGYSMDRSLAALRALAQPRDLIGPVLPKNTGYPGIGLNRYAPGLDYYGDRFEELQQAVSEVRDLPPTRDEALYEIPVVWDYMLGVPVSTRLVPQVAPEVLFRLADVSASFHEGVFEGGARVMGFRRGDGYTGAVDVYTGVHVTDPKDRTGFSVNVSYSFNSPDSATFLPLPNAHVLGFGMVLGLPEVMPPPVPIARDPLEERAKQEKEVAK